MTKLFMILDRHPEIGMISTMMSVGLSLVDVTLLLKLAGMGVGLLIGLVTLYVKLVEAIKSTRDLRKQREQDETKTQHITGK